MIKDPDYKTEAEIRQLKQKNETIFLSILQHLMDRATPPETGKEYVPRSVTIPMHKLWDGMSFLIMATG